MKLVAVLSALVVLAAGAYMVFSILFGEAQRNSVDLEYGSVSSPLAAGEKFSMDLYNGDNADFSVDNGSEDGYDPIEIFARLNWKFSQQSAWTARMQGTVNTVVTQQVRTYKAFREGMLISADLTTSSLVSGASLFCYMKDADRVMWQKPAAGVSIDPDHWLGMEWTTGTPYRSMTISGEDGFKAQNGLPAYELSVYVIRADTLLQASGPVAAAKNSSESVTDNGDGTFTVTYRLDPEKREVNGVAMGATAYYENQMIFTGGLPEAPVFDAITVDFTFNEDWQVLSTSIDESYFAQYGPVAAPCTSQSRTEFYYDDILYDWLGSETDESAFIDEYYEKYFEAYADGPVNNGAGEREITALNCLADAFGSILNEPACLSIEAAVDGAPLRGALYLDLGGLDLSDPDIGKILATAEARLALGKSGERNAVGLWVEDGDAWLSYGGVKGKLGLNDLMELVSSLMEDPASGAEENGNTENAGGEEKAAESDILGALANGAFTRTEEAAELHSVLPLGGVSLPVDFYFLLNEKGVASLDRAELSAELGGIPVSVRITFGGDVPPALQEAEKAQYIDLIPYANDLIALLSSPVLHADISYTADEIVLSGGLDLDLGSYAVRGSLTAAKGNASKTVGIAYADGCFYADLDGVKVCASLSEIVALAEKYLSLPSAEGGNGFSVGHLVETLLDPAFGELIRTEETENKLLVAVKGTELLEAFGIRFGLGEAEIGVTEGELSASALGIRLAVRAGEGFAFDRTGYTDIIPYANYLAEIFGGGFVNAEVAYASDTLSAAADLKLDLNALSISGLLRITYKGVTKEIGVIYGNDMLYLDLDGIRVKAPVTDAVELVSAYIGTESDGGDLIETLLSLDFGGLLSLGAAEDTLTLILKGSELCAAFGVDLAPGDITVTVSEGILALRGAGIAASVTRGEPFTVAPTGEYVNILPHAKHVISLLSEEYLALSLEYSEGDWSVGAHLDLGLAPFLAAGTAVITYKDIAKTVGIAYTDGAVCLDLDGIKVSADALEAADFVASFVAGGGQQSDAVEKLLSLDFGEVIALHAQGNALSLVLEGGKLLDALGVGFDLGRVTVNVEAGRISAEALGVKAAVTKGERPQAADPAEYTDLIPYAKEVAEMLKGGKLHAHAAYAEGDFTVGADISADLASPAAVADVAVGYQGREKQLSVIYTDGALYLDVDGVKLRADTKEAVSLVSALLGAPSGESDILENLFKLNFSEYLSLHEEEDTLVLAVKASKLLSALGLGVDLGDAVIVLGGGKVTVEAAGATIEVTAGGETAIGDLDGYTDILPHVQRVIELLQNEYLAAEISYKKGYFAVRGRLDLDLSALAVSGELQFTYKDAEQHVSVIYGDGALYLTVADIKVSADLASAAALVASALGAEEGESVDLIAAVFSLNFGDVLDTKSDDETLVLTVAGTKLLNAFGIDFALGDATVTVETGKLTANVLDAEIVITAGDAPCRADPDTYIDLMPYAEAVSKLVKGGGLGVEVHYAAGGFTFTGNFSVSLSPVALQGTLLVGYGEASKALHIIYGDDAVYVDLEGLKFKAAVQEAATLIAGGLGGDGETQDLLERALSVDYSALLRLSESVSADGRTLHLAVRATELLAAFGVELDLGGAEVTLTDGGAITLRAAGAEICVNGIAPFAPAETDGYIDIIPYVKSILDLVNGGYLHAEASYTYEKLAVGASVDFDFQSLMAKIALHIGYGDRAEGYDFVIFYRDGKLYADLGGALKVSADTDTIISLITGETVPEEDGETKERLGELLDSLFGLDFREILAVSEQGDAVTFAVEGAKLLSALFPQEGGEEGQTAPVLDKLTLTLSKQGDIRLFAEVMGNGLTLNATRGSAFGGPVESAYLPFDAYAVTLKNVFSGGYLEVLLNYRTEIEEAEHATPLTAVATVTVDLKNLAVMAEIQVKLGDSAKNVRVNFSEGKLYLALLPEGSGEPIRLFAGVEDAVKLVQEFLSAGDPALGGLVDSLFGLDLNAVIPKFEEEKAGEEDVLRMAIAVDALLKELGLDDIGLSVGDVTLTLPKEGDTILAELLGGELTAAVRAADAETAQSRLHAPLEKYVDVIPYARQIADLVKHNYLKADISYSGKLTVTGTLTLALSPLRIAGNVRLQYESIDRTIGIAYDAEHIGEEDAFYIYLTVDGLRVKATRESAFALILSLLPAKAEDESGTLATVEKLLSLDIASLVSVTEELSSAVEEGNTLMVTVGGTELLRAFLGSESLDLGDVAMTLKDGVITLKAPKIGVEAAIEKGGEFRFSAEDYYDLSPVLEKLIGILGAEEIAFEGGVSVKIAGGAQDEETAYTELAIRIENGYFSWKQQDGVRQLRLYLDLQLKLGDTILPLSLELNIRPEEGSEGDVSLAYGNFGAKLAFGDFAKLGDALMDVYHRLYAFVAQMLVPDEAGNAENPLPEAGTFKELTDALLAAAKTSEVAAGFDWTELVQALSIGNSEYTDSGRGYGIAAVEYQGFVVDILDKLVADGFIGLELSYKSEDGALILKGDLNVEEFSAENAPSMPEIGYAGVETFTDLIDYLGATVGLFEQKDLDIRFGGTVLSDGNYTLTNEDGSTVQKPYKDASAADEAAQKGVRYTYKGSMQFNAGEGGLPYHLDRTGKNFWVDADIFLKFTFDLIPRVPEADTGLSIEIVAVDCDLDGNKDGQNLDFYITVSTVGVDETGAPRSGYAPLRVYVAAEEMLPVLAGVVDMFGEEFGVDVPVVNEYFVRPWLQTLFGSDESGIATSEEMFARLRVLGGSLIYSLGLIPEEEEGGAPEETAPSPRYYIKSLTHEPATEENAESSLTLVLDGMALNGREGTDLTVTLKKTQEDGRTRLSGLSVENIISKSDTACLELTVANTPTVSAADWTTPKKYGSEETADTSPDGYFSVEGVKDLVMALGKTATHRATAEEIEASEGALKDGDFVRSNLFFVDGTINLSISIVGKNVDITVHGLTVNFDEKGDISLNAKLEYDGLHIDAAGWLTGGGDSDIIKGHTTLDITIKNGMIYMRRTQDTEFDKKLFGATSKPISPIVIYRALPLENFMKDYMNQICFMFNLSEDLMNWIMGQVGDTGSSTDTSAKADIGGIFKQYVNSCTYVENKDGSKLFTLNINGKGLAGNAFSEIPVKLGIDTNNHLHDIGLNLSIASIITLSADLQLRNPEMQWDTAEGKDTTIDLYSILETDMSKGFREAREAKWLNPYLEGQYTNIYYTVEGKRVNTQQVVMSLDGKELYSDFYTPSLESYDNRPGQTPVWRISNTFSAEMEIPLSYDPIIYQLIFRSDKEAAGYSFNAESGYYEYLVEEYAYGSDLALPLARNNIEKIVAFTDENGNLFTSILDTWTIFEGPIIFTAKWEKIKYQVEFIVEGNPYGDGISDWEYGQEFTYAVPTKQGYTFSDWQKKVDPEKETATFTATFTPNTYTITLISQYVLEGFEAKNGQYIRTMAYVYGSEVDSLPSGNTLQIGDYPYVLNGWSFSESNQTSYFTQLPNAIAENADDENNVTIYAVWQKKGYDITFEYENGGLFETRNYPENTELTADNMPDVPFKQGYKGVWDVPDGYQIKEDKEIRPTYTAIEYIVTVYSKYAISDFVEDGEGYKKDYTFTYDMKQPKAFDDLKDATSSTFVFGGYYLDKAGTLPVTEITTDLIENTFNSRESGNAVYVYWKDSTVTARLYSDVEFEGSTEGIGTFYQEISRNNSDYAINVTINASGYTMVGGWWYQENGVWKQTTDLAEFFSPAPNAQNTVELYAALISNFNVRIDDARLDTKFGSTVSIKGHITGGMPSEPKSADILSGAETSYSGNYYLRHSNSASLKDAIVFNGTSFENNSISAFGASRWRDVYLGAQVTFTIRKDDKQIFTKSLTSCVADGAFTVNVYDGPNSDANILYTQSAFKSWADGDCDNFTYVGDVLDKATLPTKEGYSSYWGYENGSQVDRTAKIEGNLNIYTHYTPIDYDVTFISDYSDWENESAETFRNLPGQLPYGTEFVFMSDGAEHKKFTVGTSDNSFELPAVPEKTGYDGLWRITEQTDRRVVVTAVYTARLYPLEITGEGSEKYQDLLPKELAYDTVIQFMEGDTVLKSYKITDGTNTIELPVREGYTVSYSAVSSGNVITVEVTFTEKTFNYTIKYHHNDGTETVDEVHEIAHLTDTQYEVTALEHDITRDFYEFTGWYLLDDAGEKPFTTWTATPDAVLEVYAGWEAIEYTIVYTSHTLPDGAEFTNPNNQVVWQDGVTIELQDASYSGYAFDGWFIEDGTEVKIIDGTNAKSYIDEANQQIVLYAKFHKDTVYTFQYNTTQYYSDVTYSTTDSARVGETITLPAYDASGLNKYDSNIEKQWYFAGWQLPNDDKIYSFGEEVPITADHVLGSSDDTVTITAVWKEKVTLTVNVTATGKAGKNGAFGRGGENGADVTLKASLSDTTKMITSTGSGGTHDKWNVFNDTSGKSDSKSFTVYLKPEQEYTITYEASTNATVKVDNVQQVGTKGEVKGKAGSENITINITAN